MRCATWHVPGGYGRALSRVLPRGGRKTALAVTRVRPPSRGEGDRAWPHVQQQQNKFYPNHESRMQSAVVRPPNSPPHDPTHRPSDDSSAAPASYTLEVRTRRLSLKGSSSIGQLDHLRFVLDRGAVLPAPLPVWATRRLAWLPPRHWPRPTSASSHSSRKSRGRLGLVCVQLDFSAAVAAVDAAAELSSSTSATSSASTASAASSSAASPSAAAAATATATG